MPVPTLHEVNYADENDVRDALNKVFPEGGAVIPRDGLTVVASIPIDDSLDFDLPDGYEPDQSLIDDGVAELEEAYDDMIDLLEKQGWDGTEFLSAEYEYEDNIRWGYNSINLIVYLYA